ncbi:MAG: ATP-dependent DNA ligase [Actinomycetales bacterium]
MDLPVMPPVAPMLATATASIEALPQGDYLFEPKWDGFRAIVFRDGDEVEIASRGEKSLTRYFPELVDALRLGLPSRCVLDGEVVVIAGLPGAQRLDWDLLAQRIHPAESRIALLAGQTPASFIAFDLLADERTSFLDEPFDRRRQRLEELFEQRVAERANEVPATASGQSGEPTQPAPGQLRSRIELSRVSRDAQVAKEWFSRFEGAGLDGIVAKPVGGRYQPGKRVLRKIKHHRTAEAVVIGYRIHKSGSGVGSLLLGLYSDDGTLLPVGGASAFTAARRLELVDELDGYVERDAEGAAVRAQGQSNRFNSSRDNSFVQLRPELVVEVAFDQLEKHRFRHAVRLLRMRPDREAASCTYDQVERAADYDFGEVLES